MIVLLLALAGCGGSSRPEPEHAETDGGPATAAPQDDVQIEGIMGSYGRDVVVSLQAQQQDVVFACYQRALSERAYAYGRIVIAIRVAADGRVIWAHPKETDLGHRGAEKCMVDEVVRRRFPAPQGHAEAELSFSYEFEPAGRPAEPTDPERLGEALTEHRAEIDACTHGQTGYTLTLYADRQGAVTAAGVSTPDAQGADAADCLSRAASHWTLPPGGSWYAKVSVGL